MPGYIDKVLKRLNYPSPKSPQYSPHDHLPVQYTTKGTRQDTDGKWWEHYEIALKLYVKCIEMLRAVAPVDVVH